MFMDNRWGARITTLVMHTCAAEVEPDLKTCLFLTSDFLIQFGNVNTCMWFECFNDFFDFMMFCILPLD